MRRIRRISSVLLAGTLLVSGGLAQSQGQTVTDSFQVRIQIQGTCQALTATDIDFGAQVPVAGTHTETGTIRLQCTNGLPFHLGLDGGTTTGDVNARAMVNATGVEIPYTLRRDTPTGPVWGNDSTSWYTGAGKGLGSAYEIALTVYAQATLNGNEPAGSYQDTVLATLTY